MCRSRQSYKIGNYLIFSILLFLLVIILPRLHVIDRQAYFVDNTFYDATFNLCYGNQNTVHCKYEAHVLVFVHRRTIK